MDQCQSTHFLVHFRLSLWSHLVRVPFVDKTTLDQPSEAVGRTDIACSERKGYKKNFRQNSAGYTPPTHTDNTYVRFDCRAFQLSLSRNKVTIM